MIVAQASCSPSHDKPAPPPVAKDAAAPTIAIDAASAVDAVARKLFITGAGRCGECHEKMFDEWEVSAHEKASTSALYQASLADAKHDATCDRCHAPLAAFIGKEPIASEGVTCDVCHTLRDPAPATNGGQFRLAVDDMVKYGPRCNLKDHYFHRMGCSPEHDKAIICGACHLWKPNGLPVFTEYEDFLAGPAAKKGMQCQDCHMPRERAALATGSPVRDGVPHHGLLGLATDLRTRALALEVATKEDGDTLAVTVTVSNVTAGHTVPAGLPERRILVRVRIDDDKGLELDGQSRALGRILVDDHGAEAPFWRATKVASDTRIAAGGAWHETFHFHPKTAGKIAVELRYRGVADLIANELGLKDYEDQLMTSAELAFGPPGARPPKSIVVKPKAAGGRKPK